MRRSMPTSVLRSGSPSMRRRASSPFAWSSSERYASWSRPSTRRLWPPSASVRSVILPSRPLALLVLADAQGASLEPGPESVTLLDATTRARLLEAIEPALRPSIFAARDANAVRLASAAHASRHLVIHPRHAR